MTDEWATAGGWFDQQTWFDQGGSLTNAVWGEPPMFCLTNGWFFAKTDRNMIPTYPKLNVHPCIPSACIHIQPFVEAFIYTHMHINLHWIYRLRKISWLPDINFAVFVLQIIIILHGLARQQEVVLCCWIWNDCFAAEYVWYVCVGLLQRLDV